MNIKLKNGNKKNELLTDGSISFKEGRTQSSSAQPKRDLFSFANVSHFL